MNSTRPLVFFVLFCVILFEVWGGLEASEVVFEGSMEVFSLSACLSKQLELIERKATGWARQVRQQLVVNYQVSLLLRRSPAVQNESNIPSKTQSRVSVWGQR